MGSNGETALRLKAEQAFGSAFGRSSVDVGDFDPMDFDTPFHPGLCVGGGGILR